MIVAHNHTEGLRTAAEQALLRAVVGAALRGRRSSLAPGGARAFTLVELRGDGRAARRAGGLPRGDLDSIASAASGAPQFSSEPGASVP